MKLAQRIAQAADPIEFNLKEEAQDVIPYADQLTGEGGASQGLISMMMNLLNAIMMLGLLVMFIYLIWGAFEWITAAGDSGKITKARDRMLQAVAGVIVLSATLAVFRFVQEFIGIEVIHFE